MVRVKRGNIAQKRHKKILHLAKGYKGAHSRLFRVANQQVMKALRYSYKHRKENKRMFRKVWITRINAAARVYGFSYSCFIFLNVVVHYNQIFCNLLFCHIYTFCSIYIS